MTAAPEPLVRLAQYIEYRIAELALEYAEVCRLAEISDETLSKIRKGKKARGSTYRKLERALQWQQGSIAAVLEGGEPAPIAPHGEPVSSVPPVPSYDDAALTDALIEKVLAGLPPERREAVLRHHLEQVRRQVAPPGEPEGERHTG